MCKYLTDGCRLNWLNSNIYLYDAMAILNAESLMRNELSLEIVTTCFLSSLLKFGMKYIYYIKYNALVFNFLFSPTSQFAASF